MCAMHVYALPAVYHRMRMRWLSEINAFMCVACQILSRVYEGNAYINA